MIVKVDSAELLRIINKHKGKTLGDLEEINCPVAYLDVFRNRYDYLRSEIVALANGKLQPQS